MSSLKRCTISWVPRYPHQLAAMIVRFYNFSDCQRLILLLKDLAAATQKRWHEYDQVRKKLQNIPGVTYAIYPAPLGITVTNTGFWCQTWCCTSGFASRFAQSLYKGCHQRRLLSLFKYAVCLNILLRWINNAPPTIVGWYKLIFQIMPNGYLRYRLKCKNILDKTQTYFFRYAGKRHTSMGNDGV